MIRLFFILIFLSHISFAEEFFITVGGINGEKDGHKLEGQFGTIYKSSDLSDWQEVFKGGPVKDKFSHARNNLLRCMAYGDGTFVATGNPYCVLVSHDGSEWQEVSTPSGAMSIAYGNGIFLAPNASHFMISKNAKKWKYVRQPGKFKIWGKDGAGHVRKTIFGNGVFVMYGEQRVSVTKDGKSFLKNDIITDINHNKSVITFGNGKFLWINPETGHKISEDGLTWKTLVIDAETLKDQSSFLWTGEKFFVKAKEFIYSSENGMDWQKQKSSDRWFQLTTFGNDKLVNYAGWERGLAVSKDEGKNWTHKGKLQLRARKFYFFNGNEIIGHNGG